MFLAALMIGPDGDLARCYVACCQQFDIRSTDVDDENHLRYLPLVVCSCVTTLRSLVTLQSLCTEEQHLTGDVDP